ncbi:MAG: hypothetical protein LWW76_02750 [Burkholderiales bacterium]|jgi:threonine/homoserine/homoserine lactone efflux protein|nr:hypothetical protein [Burkholderiales bacterium]
MYFNDTIAELFAMATFAFVNSVTPCPNNAIVVAFGCAFCFNCSIPHMIGIASGFCVMILLCCIGGYNDVKWLIRGAYTQYEFERTP